MRRAFAAFEGSRRIPVYIKECEVIVTRMTGNPWFPSLTSVLTGLSTRLLDLRKAEEAAYKGPKGAAQDRNAKLEVVRSDMRLLKAGVQGVADANMAEACAIIESSGMSVAKSTARTKPPFTARYAKVPGRVALDARAVARKATYYWEMSTDGETWAGLPDTLAASTSVDGLAAGTLYFFRFRTLTRAGVSGYSAVISIRAH